MKFSKTMTLASVVAVAFAVSACDAKDFDCNDTETIYSEQTMKTKREVCAEKKTIKNQHTHADGTTHIHEYNGQPHTHKLDKIVYDRADGLFLESDNNYDRESTLDNLKEDDVELIGNVTDGGQVDDYDGQ